MAPGFKAGAVAAALALSSAPVMAQAAARDGLSGPWTIARTSEWPDTCSLTLQRAAAIGGYGVKLERGCPRSFKWTADIAAWRAGTTAEGIPQELVLQDATRHALIHFKRGEDDDWVGPGPDGQDYVARATATRRQKRKRK